MPIASLAALLGLALSAPVARHPVRLLPGPSLQEEVPAELAAPLRRVAFATG